MSKEDYQLNLAKLCTEVFGDDTETAVLFMIRPHPELQFLTPACVAVSECGAKSVEKTIRKGLHGLPHRYRSLI